MPISLKVASGTNNVGYDLAAGNTIIAGIPTTGAQWGNVLSASNVNISGATITQMLSADIPVGQNILISAISLSELTTTAGTVDFELEIDGVVVATSSSAASTDATLTYAGRATISSSTFNELFPRDLLVKDNFKIRAKKTAATAAAVTVGYIKVKG